MKESACVKIGMMCEEIAIQNGDLNLAVALPLIQDDVVGRDDSDARAAVQLEADIIVQPKKSDSEVPSKKRKTRRGKSKRHRNVHPYRKNNDKLLTKMIKAEAPYNSNRFLIEDHGDLESIDEELKKTDQASTSTVTRTRDSSFSMDSDGEFYSTPDDEEVFLIKDFDDQYESLQAERLQGMSKDELIKEYLMLEGKVELLTKRLRTKPLNASDPSDLRAKCEVQKEIQRLTIENESLKRENDSLRSKVESSSDSADSETDSSDTCSSSSSSLSRCESPVNNVNSFEGISSAEKGLSKCWV